MKYQGPVAGMYNCPLRCFRRGGWGCTHTICVQCICQCVFGRWMQLLVFTHVQPPFIMHLNGWLYAVGNVITALHAVRPLYARMHETLDFLPEQKMMVIHLMGTNVPVLSVWEHCSPHFGDISSLFYCDSKKGKWRKISPNETQMAILPHSIRNKTMFLALCTFKRILEWEKHGGCHCWPPKYTNCLAVMLTLFLQYMVSQQLLSLPTCKHFMEQWLYGAQATWSTQFPGN